MRVIPIPQLTDNYAYLVIDDLEPVPVTRTGQSVFV